MFSVTVSDVSEVSGFARFYEKFIVNLPNLTFNCYGMDEALSETRKYDFFVSVSSPYLIFVSFFAVES